MTTSVSGSRARAPGAPESVVRARDEEQARTGVATALPPASVVVAFTTLWLLQRPQAAAATAAAVAEEARRQADSGGRAGGRTWPRSNARPKRVCA